MKGSSRRRNERNSRGMLKGNSLGRKGNSRRRNERK
jgi:hypothetical protein